MSYISVIGAGSWGTTLSCLLADKGYDVTLWVYEKDLAEEIKRTRRNGTYLPELAIPDNVAVTSDIIEAIDKSRYILSVLPTQHTRKVFQDIGREMPDESVIVSASKGIEKGTNMTVSGILREVTGRRTAALSGPSFAKEVAKKFPTAVTLASEDYATGLHLQEIFTTPYFRVYYHHDVLGVEIGGALKNVIAIAAGISDGLGLGYNSRSALITRGLAEMARLGVAMGAQEATFSGLSGLGDLVLTCTGPLSRNYSTGVKLGQGMKLREIIASTKSVVEGVETAVSAMELSRAFNIEMPIVEQVYSVLYEDKSPSVAVKDLMTRTLKREFHGQ